jgi:hypothetical protein
MQNGRVLRATFIEHGKIRTCTYYLDGTESKNLAAGGAPSQDTATVKFATLLIDSTVRVPKATLQMEQKWQLSADSRHLIVQITASATSAAVSGYPLGTWENVYNRKPSAEVKGQKSGVTSQKPGVRRTPPSSPQRTGNANQACGWTVKRVVLRRRTCVLSRRFVNKAFLIHAGFRSPVRGA